MNVGLRLRSSAGACTVLLVYILYSQKFSKFTKLRYFCIAEILEFSPMRQRLPCISSM